MRRSGFVAFAAVMLGVSAGAACSLEDGGFIPPEGLEDGSIGTDGATLDARSSDGQVADGPTITADSGSTDAAPDADGSVTVADAGPTFLCGFTQVANCATDCPAAPHDCPSTKTCIGSCYPACVGYTFQCDACGTDGGRALSRCEPEDASAYAECLVGHNRCTCPGNTVADCPGTNQTCENNTCFECAEPDGGNQVGHFCAKGGGAKCDSNGACN